LSAIICRDNLNGWQEKEALQVQQKVQKRQENHLLQQVNENIRKQQEEAAL